MTQPYVGEIRMFAGTYAPKGWAFCTGALLTPSQNTWLYSLLGTRYGGNGFSNFALPDLCGRAAIGAGTGQNLTPRVLAEKGGEEAVSLTNYHTPRHGHEMSGVMTR